MYEVLIAGISQFKVKNPSPTNFQNVKVWGGPPMGNGDGLPPADAWIRNLQIESGEFQCRISFLSRKLSVSYTG